MLKAEAEKHGHLLLGRVEGGCAGLGWGQGRRGCGWREREQRGPVARLVTQRRLAPLFKDVAPPVTSKVHPPTPSPCVLHCQMGPVFPPPRLAFSSLSKALSPPHTQQLDCIYSSSPLSNLPSFLLAFLSPAFRFHSPAFQ